MSIQTIGSIVWGLGVLGYFVGGLGVFFIFANGVATLLFDDMVVGLVRIGISVFAGFLLSMLCNLIMQVGLAIMEWGYEQ